MSTINTSGIDTNYPVPGQNNSSQGFRTNFQSITQNLNIAATEITDLQNNAVLKAPLANTVLNNDMANALISNCSTLAFRATTYNLGNALVGTVLVDVSLGDVQYGNVAGNVVFQFGGWAPTLTSQTITLQLGIANSDAVISWPAEIISTSDDFGVTMLENYQMISNVATVTAPNEVTQLNYRLTSIDCGNSIYIEPINRPYQAAQIVQRTPPPTGQQGDTIGTVCVDKNAGTQLEVTSLANNYFITTDTSALYTGLPVVFTASTGNSSTEPNVTLGSTYYISNVANSTAFQISVSPTSLGVIDLSGNLQSMKLNPMAYMYVAVSDFNANYSSNPVNISSTASPNLIIVSGTTNLANNNPIIFFGTDANLTNLGLEGNTVYYIKNYWSGNNTITLSQTRYNGVAGPEYQGIQTVAANPSVDYVVYNGSDIFRRIPLYPENLPSENSLNDVVDGNLQINQNLLVVGNSNIQANLSVTGNINCGNINGGNLVSANFLQGDGSLISNIAISAGSYITNGSSNVSIPSAGGNVRIDVAGNANVVVVTGTGANITGTLNATGNANVANLGTAGLITATGNVSGGNLVASGTLNVTGNANVGNIGAAAGVFTANVTAGNVYANTGRIGASLLTGTLTTSAQSNITSLGNLTGLIVNGNVTSYNVYANSGTVGASLLTGTLTTLAQPNITSVGTLSALSVGGSTTLSDTIINGNLTISGNYTYENVTSLAVQDPVISLGRGPNNTPLTVASTKDRGTQMWYFDTTEKSSFIGYDVSQSKIIAAASVTNSSDVVTVVDYGTFKVGNLEAENITVASDWVNVNIPTVNDIHIGGGLNGYYLVTDGTGNLSWVSGGGSGSGVVGGANSQIQFNNSGSFGGSANLTFNSVTNLLTLNGNISANNITSNTLAATTANITGNITSDFIILSVNNAVTAAGSDQSTATLITKSINVLTTVPSGSGVKLPAAVEGLRVIIRNSTSTAALVYPNTDASIEPALPNFPYTLNATTSMEFFCSTGGAAGQWFTLM